MVRRLLVRASLPATYICWIWVAERFVAVTNGSSMTELFIYEVPFPLTKKLVVAAKIPEE